MSDLPPPPLLDPPRDPPLQIRSPITSPSPSLSSFIPLHPSSHPNKSQSQFYSQSASKSSRSHLHRVANVATRKQARKILLAGVKVFLLSLGGLQVIESGRRTLSQTRRNLKTFLSRLLLNLPTQPNVRLSLFLSLYQTLYRLLNLNHPNGLTLTRLPKPLRRSGVGVWQKDDEIAREGRHENIVAGETKTGSTLPGPAEGLVIPSSILLTPLTLLFSPSFHLNDSSPATAAIITQLNLYSTVTAIIALLRLFDRCRYRSSNASVSESGSEAVLKLELELKTRRSYTPYYMLNPASTSSEPDGAKLGGGMGKEGRRLVGNQDGGWGLDQVVGMGVVGMVVWGRVRDGMKAGGRLRALLDRLNLDNKANTPTQATLLGCVMYLFTKVSARVRLMMGMWAIRKEVLRLWEGRGLSGYSLSQRGKLLPFVIGMAIIQHLHRLDRSAPVDFKNPQGKQGENDLVQGPLQRVIKYLEQDLPDPSRS